MADRKYKCYLSMTKVLSRDEIKFPGKNATYLLDTFIFGNGRILNSHLVSAKIIPDKDGEFTKWFKALEKKQWIGKIIGEKHIRYYPGPMLLKYLNTEKLRFAEVATKPEIESFNDVLSEKIDRLEKNIEDQNKIIQEHGEAIKLIIEKFDPPFDEKKKEAYLSLAKS